MALEEIGFKSVIEGVAQYAANAKLISSVNKNLATSIGVTAKTFTNRGQEVTRFFDNTTKRFVGQADIASRLDTVLRHQTGTIGNLGISLAGAAKPLSLFQRITAGAIGPIGKLGGATRLLSGAVSGLPGSLAKSAYFLGRLQFVAISSIAALAALAAPIKFGADFETQITKITNLTETSVLAARELRGEILKLSSTVAVAPTELAAGAYQILSSGIKDTSTAMLILEGSAKASAIGLGQTATVARVTTAIINAYGLSVLEVNRVLDALANTVKLGSGESEDFAQSLGFVIPFAAQAGVEIEQVGAALATMTNQGLAAENAVIALKGIFTQLIKPSQESRKVFEALDLNVEDFRREVNENFIAAMEHLIEVTHGSQDVLAALFPDVRGLLGVFSAFGIGLEQTKSNFEALEEGVGIVDEAFARVQQTTAFKFKKAMTEVQISLTELGARALPFASRQLDKLSNAIDQLRGAAPGVFRDWLPVLRELGPAIKGVSDPFISFGQWVINNQAALTFAIVALGIAFAWTNPVGAIVLGIGAVVGGLALIRTNSDELSPSLLKLKIRVLELTDSLLAIAQVAQTVGFTILGGIIGALIGGIAGGPPGAVVGAGLGAGIFAGLAVTAHSSLTDLQKDIHKNLAISREDLDNLETGNLNAAQSFKIAEQAAKDLTRGLGFSNEQVQELTGFINDLQKASIDTNKAFTFLGPEGPLSSFQRADPNETLGKIATKVHEISIENEFVSLTATLAARAIVKAWREAGKPIDDIARSEIIAAANALAFQTATQTMAQAGVQALTGLAAQWATTAGQIGQVANALFRINQAIQSGQGIGLALVQMVDLIASFQDMDPIFGTGRGIVPQVDEFGANLLDSIRDTKEEGLNAWGLAAKEWLDAVKQGILDGTVDVLDALDFLERGMIDAARSITEGLAEQAEATAEQWQILIDILTQGLVTIQQVNRLFQLEQNEAALDLLHFLAGRPSNIGPAIGLYRQAQALPRQSFQEGGYVPAGAPVPAILHGPELVVPLGNQMAMMRVLSRLGGAVGGIAGGFKNYGQVSIVDAGGSDSRLLKSMVRALN